MSRLHPVYCKHNKCVDAGDESFGLTVEHCALCEPYADCKHHLPWPFCDVCHQSVDMSSTCGIKDPQKHANCTQNGYVSTENGHDEKVYGRNNDARSILKQASDAIQNRAITRDNSDTERSMQRTINIFNGLINNNLLNEAQGWLFMACVKLARSQQGQFHLDDYIDAAAYIALAGEAAHGPAND